MDEKDFRSGDNDDDVARGGAIYNGEEDENLRNEEEESEDKLYELSSLSSSGRTYEARITRAISLISSMEVEGTKRNKRTVLMMEPSKAEDIMDYFTKVMFHPARAKDIEGIISVYSREGWPVCLSPMTDDQRDDWSISEIFDRMRIVMR
jgi:nitrate reductase NapAB chaperone NapD